MYEVSEDRTDKSLEWLYDQAAKYALLTAEEEVHLDRNKWSAVKSLQSLMLRDPQGAEYLALWAQNLLHHPPSLKTFADKDYYYLLRRDHGRYMKSEELKEHLQNLGSTAEDLDGKTISLQALDLDATLAVGLAEAMLGKFEGHDMGAAINYWQGLWRQQPQVLRGQGNRINARAIGHHVDSYYKARNGLVNHNLRLVFSIAGKNTGQLPYRDLAQEGTLGLIRAAEKFRYEKGYRFSTYAFNWINQSVKRAIESMGGAVRFPSNVRATVTSIHRERSNFHNRYGQEPDREELAQLVDLEPAELDRYRQLSDIALSLDSNARQDTTAPTLIESMSGGPFEDPESAAGKSWLGKVLEERLALLSNDEQRVIVRRWGLDGSAPSSRKDVARVMDVSTEWIRQLESMGLAKLAADSTLQQVFRE